MIFFLARTGRWAAAGFLCIAAFDGSPSEAQGVETGIRDLAAQIIDRSSAAEKTTIAISAFPHNDGSCSELSNYLADELVLSLFGLADGALSIVERSQLDRILSEIELSMTGVVDANTTQELGRIAGVSTLLVGSITDVGDQLRVNARMLDTQTAQVFSAAAVNIPRTATVEALFARPAPNNCAMSQANHGDAGPLASGENGAEAGNGNSAGLPVTATDFSMAEMAGRWVGSERCVGVGPAEGQIESGPRTMELWGAGPYAARARYFRNGAFSDDDREDLRMGGLTLDATKPTLAFASGFVAASFDLVAEGALLARWKRHNEEGEVVYNCVAQLGKVVE